MALSGGSVPVLTRRLAPAVLHAAGSRRQPPAATSTAAPDIPTAGCRPVLADGTGAAAWARRLRLPPDIPTGGCWPVLAGGYRRGGVAASASFRAGHPDRRVVAGGYRRCGVAASASFALDIPTGGCWPVLTGG
jgi:hypothetical protein